MSLRRYVSSSWWPWQVLRPGFTFRPRWMEWRMSWYLCGRTQRHLQRPSTNSKKINHVLAHAPRSVYTQRTRLPVLYLGLQLALSDPLRMKTLDQLLQVCCRFTHKPEPSPRKKNFELEPIRCEGHTRFRRRPSSELKTWSVTDSMPLPEVLSLLGHRGLRAGVSGRPRLSGFTHSPVCAAVVILLPCWNTDHRLTLKTHIAGTNKYT